MTAARQSFIGSPPLERQLVEALGVAAENGFLVVLGNFAALHQLGDIALAALVRYFVRKVGRVDERLVAYDLDGEGHRQLLRLTAEEQAALFDPLDDVSARLLALAHAKIAWRNGLEGGLQRRMKPLKKQQES